MALRTWMLLVTTCALALWLPALLRQRWLRRRASQLPSAVACPELERRLRDALTGGFGAWVLCLPPAHHVLGELQRVGLEFGGLELLEWRETQPTAAAEWHFPGLSPHARLSAQLPVRDTSVVLLFDLLSHREVLLESYWTALANDSATSGRFVMLFLLSDPRACDVMLGWSRHFHAVEECQAPWPRDEGWLDLCEHAGPPAFTQVLRYHGAITRVLALRAAELERA